MYFALAQLICDSGGYAPVTSCESHFPPDGAVQTAIYSRMDLRAMARGAGWKRIDGKDFCPICDALIAKHAKLLRDKYIAEQKGGK
jgi:hypothetical protein